MELINLLIDPCPSCGTTGRVKFVSRAERWQVAGALKLFRANYFFCTKCGTEFIAASVDPLVEVPVVNVHTGLTRRVSASHSVHRGRRLLAAHMRRRSPVRGKAT